MVIAREFTQIFAEMFCISQLFEFSKIKNEKQLFSIWEMTL
jgi:hypothetical protein